MSEGWVEVGLLSEGRIGYGKHIIIIIIDDCLFRVIEASFLICYRVVMMSLASVGA